jgi:predicted Zn-dependent protease
MKDADQGLAWGLSFAHGYQELGMLSAAERELNRLPAAFQDLPEAMTLRSQLLVARESWSELIEHSRRAVALFPDLPEFYMHAVTAFDMMDRPHEGREIWESAPDSVRSSGIFHLHLARFEANHGKLASAEEHLNSAFELDPRLRDLAGLDPDFAPIISHLERN